MSQIIHPSHVCHRFANPQDPAAYISASNLPCSTSVYCFTSRNLPWKKCTLPKNRSSKASDFLCSSVKDFGTNRSCFKDNCAPFFAVFTESSDLIFKRRFDYFEVEKCRKWRCQQSNGDQFRVFSKRKLNAADTYSTKTILLGKMLDIRWRGRVRLILRHVRKWSFLANYKIWLKSLQKNWRQVGFLGFMIFLIGISCVYLGMTASLAPQEVPYSNLVTSLKAERVTTALFEEGSRVIYFNVAADTDNSVNFPAEQSSLMAEERQVGSLSVDGHGSVQKDLHLISGDSMGGISVSEAAHNAQQMEDYQSTEALIEQKNFIHKELQPIQPRILQKYAVSEKSAAKGWTSKAPSKAWKFSTRRIKHDESFLLGLMRESGVTYSSAPQSVSATLRTLLITILTLWIPLSPLLFLLHRQLSTNSASTRKRKKQAQFVKFDDVAGVDAAKEELMEIVSCLRGASTFKSLGAKLPKGILLVGPPGTGKTLLARAVASEAGVPFFAASASEFVEMFVGRGAARVRDLFAGARKCSPSIIFVDEIDAVGCKRGRSFNDERDQTLNQLLTELDGFESEKGVVVIAATNRPEALDPALCRPGRFSRKVLVKEPDFLGRRQILAVHMRGIPLAEDAEMIQKAIASITPGLVGADLANIVNEAAMLAARQGHSAVNLVDFKEATNRVKYGIGDASKIGTLVESEINRLFGWMSPRSGFSTEAGRGAPAIPTNS